MSVTKVLVVDDNEVHATGLAELLGLAGFEALFAHSGSAALELAVTHSVDAVLLDLNLPDMSGHEVCRRLRSDAKTANIAVVFHTGSQRPRYQDHEGDAFLTYPVQFSELFAVIRGSVVRRQHGNGG